MFILLFIIFTQPLSAGSCPAHLATLSFRHTPPTLLTHMPNFDTLNQFLYDAYKPNRLYWTKEVKRLYDIG